MRPVEQSTCQPTFAARGRHSSPAGDDARALTARSGVAITGRDLRSAGRPASHPATLGAASQRRAHDRSGSACYRGCPRMKESTRQRIVWVILVAFFAPIVFAIWARLNHHESEPLSKADRAPLIDEVVGGHRRLRHPTVGSWFA